MQDLLDPDVPAEELSALIHKDEANRQAVNEGAGKSAFRLQGLLGLLQAVSQAVVRG
jgi:hypothetical protein